MAYDYQLSDIGCMSKWFGVHVHYNLESALVWQLEEETNAL